MAERVDIQYHPQGQDGQALLEILDSAYNPRWFMLTT